MITRESCISFRTTSSVNFASVRTLVYGYCVESGAIAANPYINNSNNSVGILALGPNIPSQGNIKFFDTPIAILNGFKVSFDPNTTAVTIFYNTDLRI